MMWGIDANRSVTDVDEADVSWGSSSSMKIETENGEGRWDVLDNKEMKEIHWSKKTEGWCAMLHEGTVDWFGCRKEI